MSGNKTNSSKSVQSLLAPKKVSNSSQKDNPDKKKRTHSDVAEESSDNLDVSTVSTVLHE